MIIEVVGKEIEKIKGDYESYLNGLNMVGEISYSQYSELYDEGTKQIQKAYELGKAEKNTELENKIADIKANCDLAIESRDVKVMELEKENNKLLDVINNQDVKIADLEKENAELKGIKDVATLIRANNDTVVTLMQLNNMLVSERQQLTKATEILKEFIRVEYADFTDGDYSNELSKVLKQAEQFIKEIEK